MLSPRLLPSATRARMLLLALLVWAHALLLRARPARAQQDGLFTQIDGSRFGSGGHMDTIADTLQTALCEPLGLVRWIIVGVCLLFAIWSLFLAARGHSKAWAAAIGFAVVGGLMGAPWGVIEAMGMDGIARGIRAWVQCGL